MIKQLALIVFVLTAHIAFAQPEATNPLTKTRRSFFQPEIKTTYPPKSLTPTVSSDAKSKEKEKEAYLEWQTPTFNFGVVNRDKPVRGTFAFKNISERPIFIKEAKGTCDCTGVEFPKEPILPGEVAMIVATYDAKVVGPFKKTVMVQTNLDEPDEKMVLYIEGEVIWQF